MQGTQDALLKVSSDITAALDNQQNVLCVSFDSRKAYETTWRFGILRKLLQLGVHDEMFSFIKNFMSDRRFRTKIGSTLSSDHTQEQGVPQGSVLSCTLFSVAINDILKSIPPGVVGCLYVDDLLIYCSGRCLSSLERRIQTAINKVHKWAMSNGFTFSSSKTTSIHFHRKRGRQEPPRLTLDGAPIMHASSIKYLGMILDQKMTWKDHITQLKTDTIKRLDLLKCLSANSWGADRVTMMRIYRAIIRSKLDYGCMIYGSAKENILSKLDPVHNTAIRLCTGAFKSSPVCSLYADSGELPLSSRRKQLMLQYYVRIQQIPTSPAYNYILIDQDIQLNENDEARNINYRIQNCLNRMNKSSMDVIPFKFSVTPVWLLSEDAICRETAYPTKRETSEQHMRAIFMENAHEYHQNQTAIFSDGSKSRENVGCAAVCHRETKTMKLLKETSIFTAEITGILCALKIVMSSEEGRYVIYCDSKSVLQAIEEFNTTHPLLKKIILWLMYLTERNKIVSICWCPSHVGIKGNEVADKKAIEAASANTESANDNLPYRDWYPIIKLNIRKMWSDEWNDIENNKLREIKSNTDEWPSSNIMNPKEAKKLTRLRIGHTLFSHQQLMERSHRRYCEDCIVPLTVKHALAECPSHDQLRERHFPGSRNMSYKERMVEILAEKEGLQYDGD